MNKNNLVILGILAIVAFVGYKVYTVTAPNNGFPKNTGDTQALVVADQKPGAAVKVTSVNMASNGFLVVRKDEAGSPGKIIGVSNLTPKGINKNITINLAENISEGQTIFVMVNSDSDGNGVFQFPGPDIPENDSSGNIMLAHIAIVGDFTPEKPEVKQIVFNAAVEYSIGGFSPEFVEIGIGQTVTFVNTSDLNMWVASDPHPTHTDLPGFDQRSPIVNGGKYTYTFTKVGAWKYHNHSDPGSHGVVIVK